MNQLLNDDDLSDPSTELNDDLKNSDNLYEPSQLWVIHRSHFPWILLFTNGIISFFLGLSTSRILLQIITRLWRHRMITPVEFGTYRVQQQSPRTKNTQITPAAVSQANLTGISLSLVRWWFLFWLHWATCRMSMTPLGADSMHIC